jgi:hypothetical protein
LITVGGMNLDARLAALVARESPAFALRAPVTVRREGRNVLPPARPVYRWATTRLRSSKPLPRRAMYVKTTVADR